MPLAQLPCRPESCIVDISSREPDRGVQMQYAARFEIGPLPPEQPPSGVIPVVGI